MSYVSVNAPLPTNSMSPTQPCNVPSVVNRVERSVANAKAAHAQIPSPQGFAEFGQGVVNDVVRSQKDLAVRTSQRQTAEAPRPAPQILPLNVPVEEYSGCSIRGTGSLHAVQVSPMQQQVQMPQPAPVDTQLLMTGGNFPLSQGAPEVQQNPFPVRQYMSIVQNPGLRGLGFAWGDSTGMQQPDGSASGLSPNWKGLLLFGAIGLGLYAVSRKGR
jgi:hypothetical protein